MIEVIEDTLIDGIKLIPFLFLAYLLCVFSVGMYEAEIITFKQCMQDFGVYMAFGCISLISKVLVRNI